MQRISIIKEIKDKILKFKTRKERFLRACAYNFYIQKTRIDLDGVNFLPFINAQHKHDWAKAKANEFVKYCKRNNIINERYKLALNYARTGK